jgi:hypothetical protein
LRKSENFRIFAKTFKKIFAKVFVKVFVIFVYFRLNIFAKNENKFSQKFLRKCENENFRFNPRLFTLLELTTKYEANTCVVLPNACRRTVITTSVVQDLNVKIAGVDCMMR